MNWKQKPVRFGMVLASGALLIALAAWQTKPTTPPNPSGSSQDTIPSKSREKSKKSARILEKELLELERAQVEMDALKEIQLERIQEEIKEAMNAIKLEKIERETQLALKQLDLQKMKQDIKKSLAEIDVDKMRLEIEKTMRDLPSQKEMEKVKLELEAAKQEMQRSLNNTDFKRELEKELEKLNHESIRKDIEKAMEAVHESQKNMKIDHENMRKELYKAKGDIEKAKVKLKAYREMIELMDEEGLLDADDDFTISYQDGNLSVNGKKQTAETADKYKKYFDEKTMTIRKNKKSFSIDKD